MMRLNSAFVHFSAAFFIYSPIIKCLLRKIQLILLPKMKNQPSFLLKLLQTILLLCSILQVLAQDSNKQFPTDIELMNLVNKHISSPITNIKKANGETYLQRNFSDYLHASPAFSGPEPQGNQADYGHDHNIEELETFLNRPHPSVATLEKYFAAAAAESIQSVNTAVAGAPIWTPDGEAELHKIPFFVRGKVRRNTEAFAAERGLARIDAETLYDAKAHFSR
jgi:hypothetical protein